RVLAAHGARRAGRAPLPARPARGRSRGRPDRRRMGARAAPARPAALRRATPAGRRGLRDGRTGQLLAPATGRSDHTPAAPTRSGQPFAIRTARRLTTTHGRDPGNPLWSVTVVHVRCLSDAARYVLTRDPERVLYCSGYRLVTGHRARKGGRRVDTQAAILWETNSPWSVEDIVLDPPKQGEVLVKLAASGLCPSDEHLVTGDLTIPPEVTAMTGVKMLPIIGGHEGAGEVVEVGPGVTTLAPGDHVSLGFVPACGRCPSCSAGRQRLCDLGAGLLLGRAVAGLTARHHPAHGRAPPLLRRLG